MTNDELKQLKQDLAAAFPEWFRFDNKLLFPFWGKQKEVFFLVQLDDSVWGMALLLQVCLDAAASRGWGFSLDSCPKTTSKYIFFVFYATGEHITTQTHAIPALAAALAILEAHKLEVSK